MRSTRTARTRWRFWGEPNWDKDATSTGGVKLCLVERRVSMVEGACLCMMMDCGCAEVLNHEKYYHGMHSFLHLRRFQLNWGSLVAALICSGQFAAEWYIQIWIRCKKQLFWSKHLDMLSTDMYLWRLLCRIARRCRLRDHTYQPQRVSELGSDGH